MDIKKISTEFTVCKLRNLAEVNWEDTFCFVGKTDEELSLVCSTRYVPSETIEREDGWRAFRIEGVLDFSLIGILSELTSLLAEQGIGIFAVSTYNTDYILTKSDHYTEALTVLEDAGYRILEADDLNNLQQECYNEQNRYNITGSGTGENIV